MLRITDSRSFVISALLLFALFISTCAAVGNGFQDVSSSSASQEHFNPQLEASPMGDAGNEHYVGILNARLKDWGLKTRPYAEAIPNAHAWVAGALNPVHSEVLEQRGHKGLLFLGETPDKKRLVHAMVLNQPIGGYANVAIVSTPKKWQQLSQNMQLHTFARIPEWSKEKLSAHMGRDFNASELDAFIRYIVPRTPQSQFDDLFPRFTHPHFRG